MSRYIPTNNEMRGFEMMRRKKKNNIMFWALVFFLFLFIVLYKNLLIVLFAPEIIPMILIVVILIFWIMSSQLKEWSFYKNLDLRKQYYYTGIILRTQTHRSRKSHVARHYVTFQTEDGTVLKSMEVPHSLKGQEGKKVVILCQGIKPLLYIYKEQTHEGGTGYERY